jgi:choline transporter-like protein 2/4/5
MWYFNSAGSDDGGVPGTVSVCLAFRWATVNHIGSLCFGSFLIAVCHLIQVVFEYFAKKGEKIAGDNCIYKMVVCVIRCYIYCLD